MRQTMWNTLVASASRPHACSAVLQELWRASSVAHVHAMGLASGRFALDLYAWFPCARLLAPTERAFLTRVRLVALTERAFLTCARSVTPTKRASPQQARACFLLWLP
jgi:hypothetical protein